MLPTPDRPWLVCDVGGTNARFGLVLAPEGRPSHVSTLPCRSYRDLASAAAAYLQQHAPGARPVAACAAVAGPVHGDRIRLTNAHWDCSISQTRRELGVEHLDVVNDFAALALSLPWLGDDEVLPVGGPATDSGRSMAVLGPGTGLGVAGLVPHSGGWVPVSGEGGHVDVPAVTEGELAAVRVLRSQQQTVTAEDMLSGPGLVRLYGAVAQLHGADAEELTPAQICSADNDPLCRETLELFCGLLGGFAGNVALTLGATGGVFLGGGILPRITSVLQASDFRRRFEDKHSMTDYVKSIATVLITASTPALLGARAQLEQSVGSAAVRR
ncbi:glucokinase [Haloactinospora alba]|uniref:Glucokinase n=1 Tax=Haloactinospora alba TaxID=405555 RepID=A0A543NIL3_9ACTN|nr:glucokinase [Haloactinospora alba]TQN31685.1 glucokinase [Haloactinospora alba]